MKFQQALNEMKRGIPMKLPSWGGYWCWDDEKDTIVMYTKDNKRLDIRETERVEYTLTHVLSDEWIPANGENTTILGGEPTFSFGEAVKYLKRGFKVSRKGWNGTAQWVCLIPHSNNWWKGFPMQDCFGLKTVNNEMQSGWIPSIQDLLAEDWVFVD